MATNDDLDIGELANDDDFREDLAKLAERHRARRAAPKESAAVQRVRSQLEHVKEFIHPECDLDGIAKEWETIGHGSIRDIRKALTARLKSPPVAWKLTVDRQPVDLDSHPFAFPLEADENLDYAKRELRRVLAFDPAETRTEAPELPENMTPFERAKADLRKVIGKI